MVVLECCQGNEASYCITTITQTLGWGLLSDLVSQCRNPLLMASTFRNAKFCNERFRVFCSPNT